MPSLTEPVAVSPQRTDRTGVGFGVGAYLLWGMFPAYWPLLAPSAPLEVLAHRVLWTGVLMLVVAGLLGRLRVIRALPGRGWAMVAASGVLIAINWGVFILAVNTGHVVEVALGYFSGPLVSMLLGVTVLRERLNRVQWLAAGIGGIAVLVLTMAYGQIPLISLTLAVSFGLYGLLKKTVPLDTVSSLTAETLVLCPLAAGYLLYLGTDGSFIDLGPWHTALIVSTGAVTAMPLLLFGAAARRIPLVRIGIIQYLAPILQFAWGVFVVHEAMPPARWIGFALVWLALAIFTADAIRRARPNLVPAPLE